MLERSKTAANSPEAPELMRGTAFRTFGERPFPDPWLRLENDRYLCKQNGKKSGLCLE